MSWDIFIQDLPNDVASVAEIPEDYNPRPIGKRSELIAAIRTAIPQVDFADPSCGHLNLPQCSMDVMIGNEDDVASIALMVHGGEFAAGVVCAIVGALQLRALDSETGDFFNPSAAAESYGAWTQYRDTALGQAAK